MALTYAAAELTGHYRRMQVIRRFEKALDGLFGSGVISGTSHFCIGQEASAMGAVAGLAPGDMIASNHRGHGHFIAKGADPKRIMAELFGRATGYSGGRGGSQHMADFSIGFLGSNGITAGMIPIATGAALSQKLLGTERVVLCFFGDGASGQGVFYEALNMGTTWRLPIIYLCENNQYAMSTAVGDAFREPSVADRMAGLGLERLKVDGNDYFAVRESVAASAELARAGSGPVLLEAMTYRMCGHSKSDTCEYRTDEEESAWAQRDPIRSMGSRLIAEGICTEDDLQALDAEAQAVVDDAVEWAKAAPAPEAETVDDNLFADF